ncbi:iron-sulfur cluster insertion protein ErpA [Anaeromyxobacter paludicola]|uniref:Iron-sulfur cluster insertion protein ErpA n=1 Tax=Anaeromyxobacter paludicola TaxID=2918171 RepID=A0ABM7XAB2_9BACT|nr:iron-sulfur cluster insertion protein ErpA [Anaeromyxobacter paludicola]BDG08792.1 iron-sulfur cluster insertion protein ErpA [Anaeromyxobacter paludicola]
MDATTTTPQTTTPPVAPPAEANFIVLTDKAVEMVKAAMAQESLDGYGIRVGVVGGGCSGFQYSMDFEKEQKDGDVALTQDGITVFVDPMSAMYLQGVTVDYVTGLQGAGFKFNNPNARNTCGCGQSFSY